MFRKFVLSLFVCVSISEIFAHSYELCDDIKPECRDGFFKVFTTEVSLSRQDEFQCVQASTISGTRSEMKEYCFQRGAQLLEIPSVMAFKNLLDHIKDDSELARHDYWIGGSDSDQEGSFLWNHGDPMPVGSPFWGDDIDEIQDPDGGRGENCVLMPKSDHHYFVDRDCSEVHKALCEEVKAPFVRIFDGPNSCLQFLTSYKATWTEAVQYCRNIPGGNLFSLYRVELMGSVVRHIKDKFSSMGSFWIDGKQRGDGHFYLLSGSILPAGTPYWGRDVDDVQDPDEPGRDNCALMSHHDFYYLADRKCNDPENEKHYFICEVTI
ncbi:hypothetical protein SK128_018562 [Halocaridina rubra]|uniref:C-type lectin domain-containing protein n=1 Tax=Halocaridina rubra TaxID=373956 RepID=A0AAN8WJE7_HALRR